MAKDGIKTGGRQKGSLNKVNNELRDKINDFLEDEFDYVKDAIKNLEGKEKVKYYLDLLQYGLPKLQAMQLENDFDKLSDEDLDRLYNKIIEQANG